MAYHFHDNVYTKSFTPREPQVELLEAACERNTIVCLSTKSGKTFIASKIIQNFTSQAYTGNAKKILYVADTQAVVRCQAARFRRLTDLTVSDVTEVSMTEGAESCLSSHVLVATTAATVSLLKSGALLMENLSLVILHRCHNVLKTHPIKEIIQFFNQSKTKPQLLGLADSMFTCGLNPPEIEAAICKMENILDCYAETCSDIVSVLRYGTHPQEMILESGSYEPTTLDADIEDEVTKAMLFLEDHRYDPNEIYQGFIDELTDIPDPVVEPVEILQGLLEILHTLGPWSADRAAFVLLIHIEKLKVTTPYERHFLLLCMVSSVLVKIRAICDDFFKDITERDRIYKYSSPKMLRLFEVVRKFQTEENHSEEDSEDCEEAEIMACRCDYYYKQLLDRLEATEDVVSKAVVLEESSLTMILKNRIEESVLTVMQKKNGCLKTRNDRLSALQCHEHFLLPRFKVPRYTRYERNQAVQGGQVVGNAQTHAQDNYRPVKTFDLDPQLLCGLIFVEKKFTAKVLFHVLNDLKQVDEDFSFLSVQFTTGKEAEHDFRKQELVLKRFRMRECNLLIGTSFLEEGIDLPKCNLVVRFDPPTNYRSYVHSKERARAMDSWYCMLVEESRTSKFVQELANYYEIEQMLLRKCWNVEPSEREEAEADLYTGLVKCFCPLMKSNCPYVDLSSGMALVNRYCAKLPSDTFTRLTPRWTVGLVPAGDTPLPDESLPLYTCSIRLPINSPVKQQITGCPMPSQVLARRFAAFQCCQLLHASHELDDTLQPITKESFWMREEEQLTLNCEEGDEVIPKDYLEPRPGTTKRQQYYHKRIAESLTDCRPVAGARACLYDIAMTLTCPLPEEQNTRGRKIHAPEDSSQGFGILTLKKIPKIGAFPIFTRSGEVQVSLVLAQGFVTLTADQIDKIITFIHYTFTSVLRLQKFLMMFDPDSSENSYFIVPTRRGDSGTVEVDWDFLQLIFDKRHEVPVFISDVDRANVRFDATLYEDAVVSPWYRNQDEPQYFYVAEICLQLTPKAAFPGTEYNTFEEYYHRKYDIQIQDCSQSLLDVDHTSARLNFLTPRYVNRKGVALPTTSEEKKRAKRENLEQKQILVPELCNIHPFPASLWRKAVCLPCILHRINALLLADQVRRMVAKDIGLGRDDFKPDFEWKPLDFGWSLADVLSRTNTSEKKEDLLKIKEAEAQSETKCGELVRCDGAEVEMQDREEGEPWIEIGTWSNDMAVAPARRAISHDSCEDMSLVPKGLDVWNTNDLVPRYGSPTSWMDGSRVAEDELSDFLSDNSYTDDDADELTDTDSDSEGKSVKGGLRIQYKEENVAEAFEDKATVTTMQTLVDEDEEDEPWNCEEKDETYLARRDLFADTVTRRVTAIYTSGLFIERNSPLNIVRPCKSEVHCVTNKTQLQLENATFGSADNRCPQLVQVVDDGLRDLPLTSTIVSLVKALDSKLGTQHKAAGPANGHLTNGLLDHQQNGLDLYAEEKDWRGLSFDGQPDLRGHPGPSPSLILQALTMSNANDGINLERLETIGDSFLKYAITTYLYCTYENIHEGKLSHLRSKQVSNLNLYRLGRRKVLGESMIATKFEPHDNWLPPCYYVPRELERALIEAGVPASHWNRADLPSLHNLSKEEIGKLVRERGEKLGIVVPERGIAHPGMPVPSLNLENMPCFIPYNLMTQHSISDKSVADCVEALIGAYLVACGPRGALLFMSWLGIKVLPKEERFADRKEDLKTCVGCTIPELTPNNTTWTQVRFGELKSPSPPLVRHVADPEGELERLLRGFDVLEGTLGYRFRDRSYLLQALTHASYSPNRLTDCYQRLEFLGDAVLDYLITRHLYEDPRHHSPGALTDLRSALVNNTIFASFAVRHDFHKYFRHLCPGLNEVVDRFVRIQQENGHSISEECYLIEEGECEQAEDVEVPKALGDVFESVAGAIFLDSGMSLDAVWGVYYRIMKNEIELFSTNVPKSPIRELFELEPETAQFGKPEKLADGRRVRVTVEVFGKGQFNGIGRNYRIAKCTAAKCALRQLKRRGLVDRRK